MILSIYLISFDKCTVVYLIPPTRWIAFHRPWELLPTICQLVSLLRWKQPGLGFPALLLNLKVNSERLLCPRRIFKTMFSFYLFIYFLLCSISQHIVCFPFKELSPAKGVGRCGNSEGHA